MLQDHNMIQHVLLTLLIVGSVCVLTHAEPSPEPVREHHDTDHYHYVENPQDYDGRDPPQEESKIVQDVFSPDYAEPSIVLDYRYLKTGGREYARSDGGQILILPKRKHGKPIMHNNFDELLEHLRQKRMAELHKLLHDNTHYRTNNGFEMRPQYTEVIDGPDHDHEKEDHVSYSGLKG